MAKVDKEELKAAQEVRAEKERILKLEKQIGDLRKSLASYSSEELQSNKQALSLSEAIGKLYDEREKSIQKIRDGREKLKNLDKDELSSSTLRDRYVQKQIKDGEKIIAQAKERRTLSIDEFKRINEISDSFSEIEDKSETLLKGMKLRKEQQDTLNAAISLAKGLQDNVAESIRMGVENSEQFAKAGEAGISAISGIVDMEEALSAAQDSALKGEFQRVNLKRQENRLRDISFLIEQNSLGLTEDQLDDLSMVRDALSASIDKAKELNGTYEEISENVKKTQEAGKLGGELLGKAFDSVKGIVGKIPGGDVLLKAFKFDDIQSGIEQKMGGAMNGFIEGFKTDSGSMFDKLKGGLSGLKDGFSSVGNVGAAGMNSVGGAASGAMQAASAGATGFGMSLAAATAGVTLIIAGVMKLAQFFLEVDNQVAEVGKELGISKEKAMGVQVAASELAAEMNVVGINSKEVVKAMQQVGDTLGGIDISGKFAAGNGKIQQMVQDSALLSQKFQLSNEEISNLQGLSTITGQSVGELSMRATTLGKGIFTAKESMKILAGIPKSVAIGMKGNVDAMIKMAQQAKLLGLDLKKVQDIGRGTLDIEQSLEAEMEARVLTGKNINLDAMRYAALNNDTAGVMSEVVKNAGTFEEFSKMNVLQQESLAKAMNMSKDELQEMLEKEKKMRDAGMSVAEATAAQGMKQEELNKLIANTTDAKKLGYLKDIAAQNESASNQEKFADMMEKIKGLAVKIVAPIMDMVSGLSDTTSASSGLLSVLGTIFDITGKIVKFAFIPIMNVVKFIGELLSPIGAAFSDIFSGGKEGGDSFQKILDVMTSLGEVIMPIGKFLGETIGLAIKMIIENVKTLFTIFEGIGKILSGDITGGFALIGEAITNFLMTPVNYIMGLFDAFGNLFSGLKDKIYNAAKTILPNWAIELLGGEGEAPTESAGGGEAKVELPSGEMPAAAGGGQVDAGGLVLVGEQGPELVQLPMGATVASTGAGEQVGAILSALGLGGATGGAGSESAGGEEEKSPIQQLVEFAQQTAAAITELVYGKASQEGEEGVSVFQQLLEETKKVVFNAEAFVSGIDKLVAISEYAYGVQAVEKSKTPEESQTSAFDEFVNQITGGTPGEMTNTENAIAVEPIAQTASPLGGFSGGIATGFGAVVDTLFGGAGGGEKENKSSGVEQKLDTLISIMTQVTTTPTIIKFGDKTIEEIRSELNLKKSVNIGLDNTYGKAL